MKKENMKNVEMALSIKLYHMKKSIKRFLNEEEIKKAKYIDMHIDDVLEVAEQLSTTINKEKYTKETLKKVNVLFLSLSDELSMFREMVENRTESYSLALGAGMIRYSLDEEYQAYFEKFIYVL